MIDSPSLGSTCVRSVEEADEVYVSAVTPWELGIKRSLGKLKLPSDMLGAIARAGFLPLAITPEDGECAAALPLHHRDPFDRMLIAQANLGSLAVVTADRQFDAYDVDMVNATV